MILLEAEIELVEDNCVPYTDSNGNEVVKYIAKVEGKQHPSAKKSQKRLDRLHKLDEYYQKIKKSNTESMNVMDEGEMQLEETEQEADQHVVEVDEEWNQDTGKKRWLSSPLQGYSMNLRNKDDAIREKGTSKEIPEISLRDTFKTFNPALLEQLARLECK